MEGGVAEHDLGFAKDCFVAGTAVLEILDHGGRAGPFGKEFAFPRQVAIRLIESGFGLGHPGVDFAGADGRQGVAAFYVLAEREGHRINRSHDFGGQLGPLHGMDGAGDLGQNGHGLQMDNGDLRLELRKARNCTGIGRLARAPGEERESEHGGKRSKRFHG
ncbi:MAG: hypothetical protein ABSF76_06870 [Opitutaceae bacterium]